MASTFLQSPRADRPYLHGASGAKRGKLLMFLAGGSSRPKASNRSHPIEQLPEELLAEMFSWFISDACNAAARAYFLSLTQATEHQFAPRPGPYVWFTIRHVCSAWRRVALAYPQLSTHICLARPECVQDLLARAGTLPLHVYDPSRCYAVKHWRQVAACREVVLAHVGRLAYGGYLFGNGAFDFVREPSCAGQGGEGALDLLFLLADSASQPSPPVFPLHKLAQLYQASTEATAPPSMTPPVRLRKLKLTYIDPIGQDKLHSFFSCMPSLEELHLEGIIGSNEDWPHVHESEAIVHPEKTAALPNLRVIHVRDLCAASTLRFLCHIVHPTSTTLHMIFSSMANQTHLNCDCVVSMLRRKLNVEDCASTEFRSMYFAYTPRACRLTLWHGHEPGITMTSCPALERSALHFSTNMLPDQLSFSSFAAGLPLAHITSASLLEQDPLYRHDADWMALLHRMPALQELDLHCEAADATPLRREQTTSCDTRALPRTLKAVSVHLAPRTRPPETHSCVKYPATLACIANDFLARNKRKPGPFSHPAERQVTRFGLEPARSRPRSVFSRLLCA